MERQIAQEDWKNAAIDASNLSELSQARGDLNEALSQARKSVELADKSGDAFQRMVNRTKVAAALHAMGNQTEAAAQFEEAERMQNERQPAYPLLYSFHGFLYCDLLLDQGRDADVLARATQTVGWEFGRLLDIALDHLSLGRAHLLPAQRGAGGDLAQAAAHLEHAVESLRRAAYQDELPRGLLARADLHTHTGDTSRAHADLDEALALTTRCGLRLHEADAHLAYARLHLADRNPAAAREHLTLARALVTATGYHRRDDKLARLEALAAR